MQVLTLRPLDDCFAAKKLQTVEPSYEKACRSIALARAYLDEARQSGAIGTTRLARELSTSSTVEGKRSNPMLEQYGR